MTSVLWFIEHGQVVWMLGLVTAVLSGPGLWWLLRRRVIRRRAQEATKQLGVPMALREGLLAEGAVVTLEGELRSGGAGCCRFDDGGDAAAATTDGSPLHPTDRGFRASRRAESLVLAVEGCRFALRGEVDVVVGSREVRPTEHLCQLEPAARREILSEVSPGSMDQTVVMRSVEPGDTVRVMGQLHRLRPDHDGPACGETGSAWELRPVASEHNGGTIPLVALTPRALRGSAIAGVVWRGAVVAGLLYLAATTGLGWVAADQVTGEDFSPTALAVGASSPLHRRETLQNALPRIVDEGLMSREWIGVLERTLGPEALRSLDRRCAGRNPGEPACRLLHEALR